VKTTQKLVICLGLLTLLSAPLAGCSGTWSGMKQDWHGMTGSDDSASSTTTTTTATTTAPAAAAPAAAAPATTTTQETTTYNR
jgi:hypothetical protein